ncbi:MAG: GlcG/HbpS family heme-binding protein [Deltaproteobacteria bacterium]
MTQTRDARTLTLDAARALAEAGEAEAKQRGWTVAIAVVNPEGGLILFHCLDGTQPASQDVAIAKARTAARFKRPTKALEDAIAGGRHALLGVPGILPLEGGVPVTDGGGVIGAVGVSGMASSEDGVIAAAALRGLER